ncbi:conserved hypothetical protein [delta proteobacterium NaphS2]|nr:conserved hypothetical protein [delta proteobacterium NaphS2]
MKERNLVIKKVSFRATLKDLFLSNPLIEMLASDLRALQEKIAQPPKGQ